MDCFRYAFSMVMVTDNHLFNLVNYIEEDIRSNRIAIIGGVKSVFPLLELIQNTYHNSIN